MSIRRVDVGRGHWYRIDGKKVDGVTTLIGKGTPKPAMPAWAARTVSEFVADAVLHDPRRLEALAALGRDGMVQALAAIPRAQTNAAAIRGTEVHRYADRLSRGETVDDVPDHIAGHVESAVRWLDDWRVAPVCTETVVGSRTHRYAGTLDLIADLPDGRRALIDYKTGQSGVWGETALQLAAYRYAETYIGTDGREHPMLAVDCAYAIWLRADGFDVIPVEAGPHVFEEFLAVARVARLVDGLREHIGESEQWTAVAA